MDENVEVPQEEPQETSQASEISQNTKNMAMLCHLLGIFTCFIGPLIIWLLKKDEDAFIDSQGKEALNFQITVALASIVAGALSCIVIGVFLMPVIAVLDLVFSIIACVKSSNGEDYKYPISLRLVK